MSDAHLRDLARRGAQGDVGAALRLAREFLRVREVDPEEERARVAELLPHEIRNDPIVYTCLNLVGRNLDTEAALVEAVRALSAQVTHLTVRAFTSDIAAHRDWIIQQRGRSVEDAVRDAVRDAGGEAIKSGETFRAGDLITIRSCVASPSTDGSVIGVARDP